MASMILTFSLLKFTDTSLFAMCVVICTPIYYAEVFYPVRWSLCAVYWCVLCKKVLCTLCVWHRC